jgi:transposase
VGIPFPVSTQWELVRDASWKLDPALAELIRQAAQGHLVHNDDTPMKILDHLIDARKREERGEDPRTRTGTFTTGIVSEVGEHRIALYFTGRHHAGENLAQVLAQRASGLDPPLQMCDALERNLPAEIQTIVGNCLAHARRQYVDVAESFPEEVRHVLEEIALVYRVDADAKRRGLSAEDRLRLHQAQSAPVMERLRAWLAALIEERKVEPNSGLGKAVGYVLKRWERLTLFLREAGAPLDNSICERMLKRAIVHRKNSLFYKTENGARVGDLYMSLIATAKLSGENPVDYLTQLQRHAKEVAQQPSAWMPWNYRTTLESASARA